MGEIDTAVEDVQEYADDNVTSPFDKILPKEPVDLQSQSNKIPYLTRAGTTKVIHLKKKNKYHKILLKSCNISFHSEWFRSLTDNSRASYFDTCRKFFDWINEYQYKTTGANCYDCLKDFEIFIMNEQGLKRSLLGVLNKLFRESLNNPHLSDSEYSYLETLINFSKPTSHKKSTQFTLSDWFNLPWLRCILGEKAYLQLESPRRLFVSFRVTISVTLQYLLDARMKWQNLPPLNFDASYINWQYDWNRMALERYGKFNKHGEPEDEFSQLLWLDLVKPSSQAALKRKLALCGVKKLPQKILYGGSSDYPWQMPIFFRPESQARYSYIEEVLYAWLAASEAIQPSDIFKLKSSDYADELNASGRMIAIECKYYKGRSGNIQAPKIMMASEPWARAQHQFIQGIPKSTLLIQSFKKLDIKMPGVRKSSVSVHTFLSMMLKLWKSPNIEGRIRSELNRTQASSLFLDAMLAMDSESISGNQVQQVGIAEDDYSVSVPCPLPSNLFSLTHIKNTAVHSESDKYRESDLINHHSHTSETEKHDYLTDANKDFVNRAGRITRVVLHDLQNVVFQPSITAMNQEVNSLELRTRVIEATGSTDATIHSLEHQIGQDKDEDEIVVTDTSDSALYFIHYIKQAELMLPKLLVSRPDWVERTLIVQLEWMTRTLSRMKHSSSGKEQYATLQAHLPPVFDHLLESVE